MGVCTACESMFVLKNSTIPENAPYETCYQPLICDVDYFLNDQFICELTPVPPQEFKMDWRPIFYIINFCLALGIVFMIATFSF